MVKVNQKTHKANKTKQFSQRKTKEKRDEVYICRFSPNFDLLFGLKEK